jgi:GTP cyclohydrolase I
MRCRGVQQSGGAGMITSALSGVFKRDAKARAEAMDLIKLSMMQGMIE